ncbi:hypothetical protein ADIMK_0836 [Marinobacterium lacunae]|uniref:Uncharacterized protein n=1 Tax=Marinobacterium lacunae TaxID=1232683 RepID=A0A081G2X9_9GAMM|nr:hypothetical protein ADIMK_0836 [Marinobacterium lacunae]
MRNPGVSRTGFPIKFQTCISAKAWLTKSMGAILELAQ